MKNVWTALVVVFSVLAVVIIGCSKKKDITLTAADFTAPTSTQTATPTKVSGSPTISPTNTPIFSATATPTFTVTAAATYPAGWIDDCEDGGDPTFRNVNDFHIPSVITSVPPVHNLGGYWITYDDNGPANNGTSYVWPMSDPWANRKGLPTQTFSMSSPGYPGSPYGTAYAVNVTGYVTTNAITAPGETKVGYVYGFFGLGTQLSPTAGENLTIEAQGCQEVDISGFTGVKFWCKGDGVTNGWSVKLPFTVNGANGGNCDGSVTVNPSTLTGSDEWKMNFTAPATWTLESFAFATFTQEGWGITISIPDGRYWKGCNATTPGTTPGLPADASSGCPPSIVQKHAKQIQFQTVGQTVVYPASRSIWIDDIYLY